jgi:hypothetical protein
VGATKIMLIRHAEKPTGAGPLGVSVTGHEDRTNLTVRGWQRAGALIALFGSARVRRPTAMLAAPTAIFASRPTINSVRPLHTVEPLALALSIGIDVSYGNDEEEGLASSATATDGIVLISWKRDGIPKLGNILTGGGTSCPQLWPQDRFDIVWVFDRSGDARAWTFTQVPQLLLPGDHAEPIATA